MLALLVLVGGAAAHIPHDTIRALVLPPDLDPTVPWYLVADPHGIPLWERSDDLGVTWTIQRAAPTGDLLADATRLTDGTLVALASDRYWWSRDDGQTWSWEPTPAPMAFAWGGDRLVLAGAQGVWGGAPGALVPETVTGAQELGLGPSLLDGDGRVWTGVDGRWTRLPAADRELSAVVTDGKRTYAGARDGSVLRWDGAAWQPCGALPTPEDPEDAVDVVEMALDGPVLYALTAWRGPFRTDDDCATWVPRPTPNDPLIGEPGGASGPDTTWFGILAHDDRVVVAGWGGAFTSLDGGLTWHQGPTVSSSYTRGLAFSPNFVEDGLVLDGTYGAAILAATGGGDDVEPRDGGFLDTNVQQILLPQDPDRADTAWAIENHVGWATTDGGRNWTLLDYGPVRLASFVADPDAREIWSFGIEDGQAVYRTLDGGGSWERMGSAETAPGEARGETLAMLPGDTAVGARCLGAMEPVRVLCSEDGGATWLPRLEGEGDESTALVTWPPDAPTRLLIGDRSGVWRSDDIGRTWARWPWPQDDQPWVLHVTPDGIVLLGSSVGDLWRSFDGGESFERLDIEMVTRARVMASRPDFATVDETIVGTADGPFVLRGVRSDTPTLVRWSAPDRVDESSGFAELEGRTPIVAVPGAGMGTRAELREGGAVSAWVRGSSVRIVGVAEAADVAEVWVDGALATLIGDLDADGTLAEVDGLAWGWHDVRVVGTGASGGVEVDAIEGRGGGEPLSPASPAEGHGCATPGGAAPGPGLVGLVVAALGLRRRSPVGGAVG